MTAITRITLENELDIVVVHKRMIAIGELLKFTLTTQTAFSTAIAEVSREIIDRTNTGVLTVHLVNQSGKYFLTARISYEGVTDIQSTDPGMSYARRLVSSFDIVKDENGDYIELQISIPRSAGLQPGSAKKIADYFKTVPVSSPYEQLKEKYASLNDSHAQKNQELQITNELNNLKTEFISIASHELKTPLTTLKAYAQMAERAGKDECSEKVFSFIVKINQQCNKLQLLMSQLLDISKLESATLDYNKEVVLLEDYLPEIIDNLKILYPQRNIVYVPADASITVFIDQIRMEQVLANVVGNAAKYSKSGSTIKIDLQFPADNEVCIVVRDEGIGMQPETASNIFKKFYRAENVTGSYGGLGMGLYISKNIVEDHGGQIWAESEIDKGSSFFFTLPGTQG